MGFQDSSWNISAAVFEISSR